MFQRRHRVVAALTLIGGLAGCGSNGPGPEHHFTTAQLRALPELSAIDGRLICTATGTDSCPLHMAVANWIDDAHYALWEPGHLVRIRGGKDTTAVDVGVLGDTTGQYHTALAVGQSGSDIAVVDRDREVVIIYDGTGHFVREAPLRKLSPYAALGFVRSTPVLQALAPQDAGPASFQVQVLKLPTDTEGRVVLNVPLPWLLLANGQPTGPAPFFPPMPSYALTDDGGLVWGEADVFKVHRKSPSGRLKWTLSSDWQGPPVTPAEIAEQRRQITAVADTTVWTGKVLDSMTALTAANHAPIAGLAVDPAGDILVGGPVTSADSVDYFILSDGGVPKSRFRLDSRTQLVLFAGDSVLVHRPTNAEPWEVRWLQLRGARR